MTTLFLDRIRVVDVLDNITLRIPEGETLAILGPSGSGKTVLLKVIAGLIEPDSGQVLYDDTPLREIPRRERSIGMVFQIDTLMPQWNVGENIGFFFKLRRRENEIPDRVQEIAAITGLGIEDLMGRFPRQLSGGERQRVAIARALTRDLDILLLDEPFAHLGAPLRHEARIELKKLLQRFGVTTIYVTHDQQEARTLGTRAAIIREGHIEQTGAYQHIYHTPTNRFVATFIGPLTEITGYARDGQWHGPLGPLPIRRDLPDNAPVILGIRPEHIHLSESGTTGTVEQVTTYYTERRKLIEAQQHGDTWSFYVPIETDIEPGEPVTCQPEQEHILYFDPETDQRIG